MKKNILILATTGGFLYKFELENVKILQSMGYDVHYAANLMDQHYIFDKSVIDGVDVQVHHIDVARSPYMIKENRRAFCQLVELIEKYDIQVVHCHTPMGGVLGRLAGRYFRKKKLRVIYTAHGFHFYKGAPLINNSLYYLVEKFLAPLTDIMVVINQEDYQSAKKFRLKKKGEVYKIPGVGLDMACFCPMKSEEREKAREKLGIQKEDFFFVSVGELNENKNQIVVLQALAQMKKEKKSLCHIKYGICGNGFFEEKIRKMIHELNLEDTVIMYGYCTRVWEILGCADASVFPSRREGLGMAGLESLSMGVPVIASDNRGTREYMRPGQNGYICRWNDTNDFIRGIEKLSGQNSVEKAEMRVRSRESVRGFEKENTNRIMKMVYIRINEQLECEKNNEEKKEKCCKDQCYYGSL